jgi:hypothetical protein
MIALEHQTVAVNVDLALADDQTVRRRAKPGNDLLTTQNVVAVVLVDCRWRGSACAVAAVAPVSAIIAAAISVCFVVQFICPPFLPILSIPI